MKTAEEILNSLSSNSWTEVTDVLSELGADKRDEKAINNKLLELLKNEKPVIRAATCLVLGQRANLDALYPLMQALEDDNPTVQKNAGQALVMLKDERALEALIECMLENDNIWMAFAEYLQKLESDLLIDLLVGKLENTNTKHRYKHVHTLGLLRNVRIKPILLQALDDQDIVVQSMAAYALRNFKDSAVIAKLLAVAKRLNPDTLGTALTAFNTFQDYTICDELLALWPKVKGLPQTDVSVKEVQGVFLGTLSALRCEKAMPILLEELEGTLRASAVLTLATSGNALAFDIIIKLLEDEDVEVRFAAIDGLGILKKPKAIPYLEKYLQDKTEEESGLTIADIAADTIKVLEVLQ